MQKHGGHVQKTSHVSLVPVYTNKFEKDVELVRKRGKDLSKIKSVITDLISSKTLDARHRDHKAHGRMVKP